MNHRAGGTPYYKAMRLLATLDPPAALAAAAESDEPLLAYRALTEYAIDKGDQQRFLDLLRAAHAEDAYQLLSVVPAIAKWGTDDRFISDLTAELVNGLPEDFGPVDAIYLFDLLPAIGFQRIDPVLLKRAITQTIGAVTRPGFNLPELRKPSTFQLRGQTVITRSLSEAALFRALAVGAVVDEAEFLTPVLKAITWAPLLKGMKAADLPTVLTAMEIAPKPVASNEQMDQLLARAREPGLDARQYDAINRLAAELLATLADSQRLNAIASLYTASLHWPAGEQQQDATRKYVSEIERLATFDNPLRDTLVERLDDIVSRLGRDPAKWPDRMKSRSLLLRYYVRRVERTLEAAPR